MTLVWIFLSLITATTYAAENTQQLVTSDTAVRTDAKFLLGGELRPSRIQPIATERNIYSTEDNIYAGYQFSKDAYLFYRQDFSTNVYHNFQTTDREGLDLRAYDGSLRGGLNNLWRSGYLSLNYEGRAYTPTSAISSDRGMISVVRSYAHLKYEITERFSITLSEAPTLHFYSDALFMDAARKKALAANPWYENRTYLSARWKITPSLRLDFPIKMSNLRYRNAGNARNSNSWSHIVYINPEVFYNINPNLYVGLGFYSASLVQSDFGGFSLENALKYGQSQIILGAAL